MNRRLALLGSSRGLGWATYEKLQQKGVAASYLLISRTIEKKIQSVRESGEKLESTLSGFNQLDDTQAVTADFSKEESFEKVFAALEKFQPTDLIYFAGGGPYGSFESKKWSDHQWALQTTFLFPARLTHALLSSEKAFPQLRHIVLIGSSVAENQPDPKASSYCAAKHALKGLVSTLLVERLQIDEQQKSSQQKSAIESQAKTGPQIHLYSPGYMQTDLLPANSFPRQQGLAVSASDEAEKLVSVLGL